MTVDCRWRSPNINICCNKLSAQGWTPTLNELWNVSPYSPAAKMCLQRMCRKRRPRSDYICAVWSGPLLSAARITWYYRMYPWRSIALTFLHIPQPHQETRGPWWSYIAHLTKQICIFTVEVSAKFTALGFLYKLYSTTTPIPPPQHPWPCFFYKSWRPELNLRRGSPKEHFCQVILKLVQWFKKFYIAIKPYALTAMLFDESWQLEQTW